MPTFDDVMRIIYNILVALLLSVSVVGCSAMYDQEAMPSHDRTTLVRVGALAPDFTVTTLDGKSVTLSQLQGRLVLLVFFASWSTDCHKQLDAVEAIQDNFDSDRFTTLVLSCGEELDKVRDFIAQRKYTFPVGVDTDRAIYSLYATEYLPRCFVIDPFGRIVALSAEYSAEEFHILCDIIASQLSVGEQL
ncbi:MAG: TlpA family protein disulfide reductase [Rikenellaceae bacterium]|nr:TlpA family protein disulfide reductase [Rikenellaceae bacterium]